MRSSLLLQEPTLQVLPSLATAIGLEHAVVLQQVYFLLQGQNNGRVLEDGERYIFNTYEQWGEHFPWWSARTIQRVFLGLEQRHLLVSRQPEGVFSRRKYYRVNHGAVEKLTYQHLTEKTIEQPKRVVERAKSGCSGSSVFGTFGNAKSGCSSYREDTSESTTEIHTGESTIRDECVKALASLENQDLSQITDWGKHEKACAIIRKVCPGLTPGMVFNRAANYRLTFTTPCTSTAVAKHWARLVTAPSKAVQPNSQKAVVVEKWPLTRRPPGVSVEEFEDWAARKKWVAVCKASGVSPD